MWQNNPSHGDNAATARSTETYRLRKIAGESEVSRSETFVSWVLKRCGYTNTPATILFNMKVSNYDKLLEAFGQKKVKTKHLIKKADKKKAAKKTRAIKRADADKLDALRKDFTRKIEYSLGHIMQTNAKNCDAISFLKGKMKKIRQVISE